MKKYKQLTLEKRYQISAFLKTKLSNSQIANKVCVHKSTITREIKRCGKRKNYDPLIANRLAKEKKKKSRRKSKLTFELKKNVDEKLKQQWSPEQISGRLKRKGTFISHTAIYQYIENDKFLGGTLYKNLRHANKKKKKIYGSKNIRGQIKNRVSIEYRPKIVDEKIRVGDWEADLVIGKNHKGALVTLVDRVSKFTLFGLVESKNAKLVYSEIVKLLAPYKKFVFTITFDNGKEFSLHEKVANALNAKVYFAHPYSSWERGLNENTNGLLRQYFPKKTSFTDITPDEILRVIAKINARPRKNLGFKAPNEVFYQSWLQEDL